MKNSATHQKSVCYYRVSKNTMDNERQKVDVSAYCQANNIQIIKTFEEKMSGAKRKRPAMTELFNYVENTKVDFVVVSELSRFGRTNEVLTLVEKLDSLKICLISLKENFKSLDDNPSVQANSRLILNIWTGLNNFELETIRYRVNSGLEQCCY